MPTEATPPEAVPPVAALEPDATAVQRTPGVRLPPVIAQPSAAIPSPAKSATAPAASAVDPFPEVRAETLPSVTGAPTLSSLVKSRTAPTEPVVIVRDPFLMELLQAPFATKERQVVLLILTFIVAGAMAVGSFIESHQPPESGTGPVIEVHGGKPVGVAPSTGMPIAGTSRSDRAGAEATRASRRVGNAQTSLTAIADALRRYGDDYSGLPGNLSPDLGELAQYGEMAEHLAMFEGESLLSYERQMSEDLRTDKGVIKARAKGSKRILTRRVTYRQRR